MLRPPSQIEVLSTNPQLVAAQNPDATRQLEALSTGIARVEQDHVPPPLETRYMGVTEDDGVGLRPTEQVYHLGAGRTDVKDVAKHELEAPELTSATVYRYKQN